MLKRSSQRVPPQIKELSALGRFFKRTLMLGPLLEPSPTLWSIIPERIETYFQASEEREHTFLLPKVFTNSNYYVKYFGIVKKSHNHFLNSHKMLIQIYHHAVRSASCAPSPSSHTFPSSVFQEQPANRALRAQLSVQYSMDSCTLQCHATGTVKPVDSARRTLRQHLAISCLQRALRCELTSLSGPANKKRAHLGITSVGLHVTLFCCPFTPIVSNFRAFIYRAQRTGKRAYSKEFHPSNK